MSNKSEAVSTVFAVLKAIDRNNAMATMICDYLISSSEEKEHFRVEAKTFIDRCKLEADQLKKQLRSKTFSSFDQLNKLLADLLYQNHDLRRKVLDIKADIVNTVSNRGATEGRATCPVEVIYGDFPDLLKKQQTGSQPLTVLCDVLMDRYNLNNDQWVGKALTQLENAYRTKLEKAYRTKLEKNGGKSTLNSQVTTTDISQENEKTPTTMVITSVTAGAAKKSQGSVKGVPVCNKVSGPLASTSAGCTVTVAKEMRKPKLTTSVTTNEPRRLQPITNPGDQLLAPLPVPPVIQANESRRIKPLTPSCDQGMDPPAANKPIIPANEIKRIKPLTPYCDQGMVPPAADKPIIPANESRRIKPITPSCDQDMVPPAADKPIIPANESKRLKGIPPPCDREPTPLTVTPVDSVVISVKEPKKLKPNSSVAARVVAESETAGNGSPTDPLSVQQIVSLIDSIAPVANEFSKPKDLTIGVTSELQGLINDTTSVDLVPAPLINSPTDFNVPVNRRNTHKPFVNVEATNGSKTSTDLPAVDLLSAPITISPARIKVPVVMEKLGLTSTASVSVRASTGCKTSTKVTSNDCPAVDLVSAALTISPAECIVPVVKENRRLTPTASVIVETATGSKASTDVSVNNTTAVDLISAAFTISPAECKVPVKVKMKLTPTTSVSVVAANESKTSTKVSSKVTPAVNMVSMAHKIPPANRTVLAPRKGRKLKSTASKTIRGKKSVKPCTQVTTMVTVKQKIPMAKKTRELKHTTLVTSQADIRVQPNNPVAVPLTIPLAQQSVLMSKEAPLSNTSANQTALLADESRKPKPMTSVNPKTDTRVIALDTRKMLGETADVTTEDLPIETKKLPETARQVTYDISSRRVIMNKATTTLSQGHPNILRGLSTTAAGHPVSGAMAARLGISKAMGDDINGQASNPVSASITRTLAHRTFPLTKGARMLEPITVDTRRVNISAHAPDSLSSQDNLNIARILEPITFDTRRVNIIAHAPDSLSSQDNLNILKKLKQVYNTPLTFDPLPLKAIVSKVITTLPSGKPCASRKNKKGQGALLEQLPDKSKCQSSHNTSPLTTDRQTGRKRQAKSLGFSSIPPAKRQRMSTGWSVQSVRRSGTLAGQKRSAESLEGLEVPPAKRRRISVKQPIGQWSFECGGWTYRRRCC